MVDVGLFPGNYFDYEDDETAVFRTREISRDVPAGSVWVDPTFPRDARSLYFDPLNPPKGSMPDGTLVWRSISLGKVENCVEPVTYSNHPVKSAIINQGSLGDSYFINTLRALACFPRCIQRLIVCEEFAKLGIYTIKFFKAGKWRYVHIDDYIPCRVSGRVHFCRNADPNETFAMLIEKAYAKLHGCYEAIAYGLIEKAIIDCTSGSVRTLRSERILPEDICDIVWSSLTTAMTTGSLAVCGRFVPDPYSEENNDRKGIILGQLYQIVDAQVCNAAASESYGALQVGMICVRNLTRSCGRWTGRWCYGDLAWGHYPDLAIDMSYKTKKIMARRKITPDPGAFSMFEDDIKTGIYKDLDDASPFYFSDIKQNKDEPDSLSLDFVLSQGRSIIRVQPDARDLHWIQVEDFVEIFNRIYVVYDDTTNASKRYLSKWIPGDYIGGSGGEPMITGFAAEEEDKDDEDPVVKAMEAALAFAEAKKREPSASDIYNEVLAENEAEAYEEEAENEEVAVTASSDVKEGSLDSSELIDGSKSELKNESKSDLKDESKVKAVDSEDDDEEDDDQKLPPVPLKVVNPNFSDNPTYPITVYEEGPVTIVLYQADRRWGTGRFGDSPRDMAAVSFASRKDRLGSCMKYPYGLGFLIVRLYGKKFRITTFKLRKMVYVSENVEFSEVLSNTIYMKPGRYAVIPYTSTPVIKPTDYILEFKYKPGSIEFEVKDLLEERIVDEEPSGDDTEDEDDEEDIDVDAEDGVSVEELLLERKRLKEQSLKAKEVYLANPFPPPAPLKVDDWEWTEDTEEFSILGVFEEVGDLARQIARMRDSMKDYIEAVAEAKEAKLQPSPSPKRTGSRDGRDSGVRSKTPEQRKI